jgi:2-hydroxychromene-2-carboxylate isomerase
MDEAKTIVVYTDYKSPYAYLAKDLIYRLEDEFRVSVPGGRRRASIS